VCITSIRIPTNRCIGECLMTYNVLYVLSHKILCIDLRKSLVKFYQWELSRNFHLIFWNKILNVLLKTSFSQKVKYSSFFFKLSKDSKIVHKILIKQLTFSQNNYKAKDIHVISTSIIHMEKKKLPHYLISSL